jgi:hypothetical protein
MHLRTRNFSSCKGRPPNHALKGCTYSKGSYLLSEWICGPNIDVSLSGKTLYFITGPFVVWRKVTNLPEDACKYSNLHNYVHENICRSKQWIDIRRNTTTYTIVLSEAPDTNKYNTVGKAC